MCKKPNIAWCIPVNRDIDPKIYQNHLGALSYTLLKGVAKIEHFIMPIGKVIDKARNITAIAALKQQPTHLFWIDQDVKIWPHAIEKLLAHKKKIVAGMYFIKGYPYHPCMFVRESTNLKEKPYNYMDNYKPGLTPVDLTGFGCMLIEAEVFRDIPYPWFRFIRANITEDVYFCEQAKLHNYDIYVDTNIKCRHITERAEIGEREFMAVRHKEDLRNEE